MKSDIKLQLFDYQKRVIDKLFNNDNHGVIAYHSMGSGKTIIALEACLRVNSNVLFVCPASLSNNLKQEAEKFNICIDQVTVISYEKLVKHIDEYISLDINLLILDEAHRLRNKDTNTVAKIKPLIKKSKKVLMLSGTVAYNSPLDFGSLAKLIEPDLKFPTELEEFENLFVDKSSFKLKNQTLLYKTLSPIIDIYDNEQKEDWPNIQYENIYVEMSNKQHNIYKYLESSLPKRLKMLIHNNVPASLSETAKINMFSSAIRQASDSVVKYDKNATIEENSKLLTAYQHIICHPLDNYFKALIYSNYLEACLYPYENILKKHGLKSWLYTGEKSLKEKNNIIEDYNRNDGPKILLISSSGGEGLNLFGTRLIQILEPHFNLAKIEQVIARGIRYKSHAHLSNEKRSVKVENYFSVFPKKWYHKLFGFKPKMAIDEYLYNCSLRKQRLIDEIKGLLKNNNFPVVSPE
jgi:SNF2 family DNA or RNA helicase